MAVELSPARLCSICSSQEAAAQLQTCAGQAQLDVLVTAVNDGSQLLTLSGSRLIRVNSLLCIIHLHQAMP